MISLQKQLGTDQDKIDQNKEVSDTNYYLLLLKEMRVKLHQYEGKMGQFLG